MLKQCGELSTVPWNPLEFHLEAVGEREGARGGGEGGEFLLPNLRGQAAVKVVNRRARALPAEHCWKLIGVGTGRPLHCPIGSPGRGSQRHVGPGEDGEEEGILHSKGRGGKEVSGAKDAISL